MHMPVRARADAATMAHLLGSVALDRVSVVGLGSKFATYTQAQAKDPRNNWGIY